MFWLKNYKDCPPGEFFFKQAEAGARTFGPSPLLGQVAADLSAFRKGNNLSRQDYRSCFSDVVRFTVARLDQRSEWIIEIPDQDPDSLIPQPSGNCAGCGAVLPP